MIQFDFSRFAEKRFLKFPKAVQERILKKLRELKGHEDIFSLLKRLHHFEPATHRLRVGSYRLIFELKKQEKERIVFLVLDVGDRKDVYQ